MGCARTDLAAGGHDVGNDDGGPHAESAHENFTLMVKSMNFKRVTMFTGPCRSTVMSRAKSQHWDADRRGACGDERPLIDRHTHQ